MNKTELVAAIADKAEISKKDSEKALKAFVDVVTEELKKGHKDSVSWIRNIRDKRESCKRGKKSVYRGDNED